MGVDEIENKWQHRLTDMIYKRIETALKDAIAFHNEGLSANDALIKSASKHELNPETICRVVESFNIAKTRAYVKTASVKDADFDLATKADVIKAVFGDDMPKTAGSPVKKDHPIEYNFEIKKTASDLLSMKDEPREVDTNTKIVMAKQAQEVSDLDLTTARGDIVFVKESFLKEFTKAAEFFSYSYNADDSDEILDSASYQYLGNKIASDVINLVSKVANLEYTVPANPIPKEYGQHPFHEILDDMIDDAEDYTAKVAEYNKAVEGQASKTEDLNGLISKVAGLSRDKGSDWLFAPSTKKVASRFEKFPENLIEDVSSDLFDTKVAQEEQPKVSAVSFLKGAGDAISVPIPLGGKVELGKIPLGPSLESDSGNKTKELEEKGYLSRLTKGNDSSDRDAVDSEMQNVQRQALVHDLIANDEIISTYDPKIALSAYNTMLKLAPKASMMPDVVRSVLRYATAQTIDPNYASQLVELENNLNKREGLGDQKK